MFATVKEIRVRYRITEVRSMDVCPQALRRFIGHFHTVLQNGNGEMVCGVAGQPKTEIWMDVVRIQSFLKKIISKSLIRKQLKV